MKSIFDELGLAGTMVVVFFIGLGMVALTSYDRLGTAVMCLGSGFLLLIGAKETTDIFSTILGIIGLCLLAASGILFATAL